MKAKEKSLKENMEVKWAGYIRKLAALMLGMAMIGLTACGSAEPYKLVLGSGVEVTPGTTTVQEMADAGYEFKNAIGMPGLTEDGNVETSFNTKAYDIDMEVEGNTIYLGTALVKDGKKIANVSIVNRSLSEKPLAECIICDIEVGTDFEGAMDAVINGMAFGDISKDSLTEALGKPDIAYKTGDYCKWEKGKYSIDIYMNDDGSTDRVGVGYNEH
ncbi:MAG: hypothetical protein HDR71_04630 [Lachnospiraceae bacterium]|nr:hypothetical protein [Lachnospiraceae bacterium]